MRSLFLLDAGATVFTKKEKTLYFLLLFFFFALYMPGITWLYNVAMWMIFVYSFFFNPIKEKWALLKKRLATLLIILFFLLNCVSALLSDNTREGISWVGIRISLMVFPLAIASMFIGELLKQRILLAFTAATTVAGAGCFVYGIARVAISHDRSLLYNDNLSHLVNLQSIYFAMLINLALLSFGYLQLKKSAVISKYTWLPALLILLPVHFLLASRIAIIILYGSVVIFSVYFIVSGKKRKEALLLLTSIAAAGLLFFLIFPKTLNRFKEMGYTHFNYNSQAKESHFNTALTADQWNGANIRIAVWECAWTVTRHHLFFGTGLGDKMDMLRKQYAEKDFIFGIKTNRNVHNNFLDVWMSLGLLGLLIFLAGFFGLPLVRCMETADWYGLLVLTCFFISLFTETYMDRTVGNTILAFFVSFISSYKKDLPGNAE